MSYINDALKKTRKEKESVNDSYADFVGAQSQKSEKATKKYLIAGIVMVVVYCVVVVIFFWPDLRRTSPVAASVESQVVAKEEALQDRFTDVNIKPSESRKAATPEIVLPPPAAKTQQTHLKEATQSTGGEKKTINQEISGKKLAKVAPVTNPSILYAKALQKQREGRLLEAKDLLREVIKIEPRNVKALNNLGVVYLKLKRYKWAAIRLNDAIKIKPDYAEAHYNLACLYAQKNDTRQTMFYLKNAIGFNPEARHWAAKDDDFQKIASLPEFKKIIQSQVE